MNQVFTFQQKEITAVVDTDGTPWFKANDVCEVLGYVDAKQALTNNVDPDDVEKRDIIDSLGRTQAANHLNESGLYSLIFGSKLPSAKAFKRWVTSEVLPSIRKTGRYEDQERIAQLEREKKTLSKTALMVREKYDGKVPVVWAIETQKAQEDAGAWKDSAYAARAESALLKMQIADLILICDAKTKASKEFKAVQDTHDSVRSEFKKGYLDLNSNGNLYIQEWVLDAVKHRLCLTLKLK